MTLSTLILFALAAGAGSSRSAAAPAGFRLVILKQSWGSLGLGYQHETSWAKLRSVSLADALLTITAEDLESYEWATQSLTLTENATRRLVAALPSATRREEGAEKLTALTERLGWGSAVERALYTRPFVVLLGDERLYGGIFLDPPSQMAIDFPVARCSGGNDRVVFRLLPVHLPFFDVDPGADQAAPPGDLLTRDHGPVDEVPSAMLDSFRRAGRSPHACAMRALIRDDRIRADLVRAGKLRDSKPKPPAP
jgi:hypothetical protein